MARSKQVFLVVKEKFGTAVGAKVIEVVKDELTAKLLSGRYDEQLSPQERAEGWNHSVCRTNKVKLGTDPAMATKIWGIECGVGPGAATRPISRLRN